MVSNGVTCRLYREGELTRSKRAEQALAVKSRSLAASASGGAGDSTEPGGRSGSMQHACSGVEAQQSSKRDPWFSQAPALGGRGSEFLQPTRGAGPSPISAQMESFSGCPDLWFGVFGTPAKGVHYTPLLQSCVRVLYFTGVALVNTII